MIIDERRRNEFFRAAVEALGQEPAETMFAMLPPVETELATRADLDALARHTDARFDAVDARFDALEQRVDARIDALRDELLAAFRGELVATVAGQTRTIIVAVTAGVAGISGLALTLAQVL